MAQLSDINSQLVSLVEAALANANLYNISVGTEWPNTDSLQNADQNPVIAIIHKQTSYQPRNMRFEHSETVNPVGTSSALSDTSLSPGQSVTLTLSFAKGSSAVNEGDTVSFVISNGDSNNAATFTAPAGATLQSMADGLANAIASKITTFQANSAGSVVTITNNDTAGYTVSSNVGNSVDVMETVNWAIRSMQINAWCGDLKTKYNIQSVLETLLAQISDAPGFFLPSGEWVYLKYHGAKPDDEETDKNVYCDFYLFTIENMVDVPVEMWTIVAPISNLSQS